MANDIEQKELNAVLAACPPDAELKRLITELNEFRKEGYQLVCGVRGAAEIYADPHEMGTMDLRRKIDEYEAELKKLGLRGLFSKKGGELSKLILDYKQILEEKERKLKEINKKIEEKKMEIAARIEKRYPNVFDKLSGLKNSLADMILEGKKMLAKKEEEKPKRGEALAR
ncbi:MAG: hypothetical protein QXH27_03845 [Candidatus Micrarchaeia archaeon]